jgi:hypothetical protein
MQKQHICLKEENFHVRILLSFHGFFFLNSYRTMSTELILVPFLFSSKIKDSKPEKKKKKKKKKTL